MVFARLGRHTRTNSAAAALRVGTSGMQDVRLSHHQWETLVSVASRRSAWQRTGYSCAKPTRQTSSGTFLRVALLKGLQYVPRVIITDKLKSYGAAKREILRSVEHRQHKGLNNRAERSHQPTRQREYIMRRFRIPWARATFPFRFWSDL
jgi:hypothetical protein